MGEDISDIPEYRSTIERLEGLRRTGPEGEEYWMARELHPALGYPVWDKFEPVIERARESLLTNGVDVPLHIAQTSKLMEVGQGARRKGVDYFLSRPAAYLIVMNGDPAKIEIAAGQAYFAIQTRRQEIEDQDQKRLALRDKVSQSHRRVSAVANEAGVRSRMQGVFHDARYQGLYGMSLKDLKGKKGLRESEQIFDRAGPLELSMNDFQMNLAADVIAKENIRGEQPCIQTNKRVAQRVRATVAESKATLPENLPLEPPIKEVRKRLDGQKKLPPG